MAKKSDKRKYTDISEYLEDNKEQVDHNLKVIMQEKLINQYIHYMSDSYFGKSKTSREHYMNIFLDEYSKWCDEPCERRMYISLYATTMQAMVDYWVSMGGQAESGLEDNLRYP